MIVGHFCMSDAAPGAAFGSATVRVIPAKGIHNLRDYGGYRRAAGNRLRSAILFRSGELCGATESDLQKIADLRLSAIVDLRGQSERDKSPSARVPGPPIAMICTNGETARTAPHISAIEEAFDAASARRNMCARYSELPFRPALVEVYRRYFQALSNSAEPTLVYCTAGKDRTGVLVALLHLALGVHVDDVFADYLLTNEAGDAQARVSALKTDLQRRFGARLSDEAVKVVTSVEPVFLQTAFDAMTTRQGSVEAYLEEALGVTPRMLAALNERLVE
jgi:protein tyrosine/serine phosphatase